MIHPDTEVKFINKTVQYGVVATKFIPKGTITWVQDELDTEYTPEQISRMQPLIQEMLDKYSFRNNLGNHILCWDDAKFVNHSFKSNCMSTAYDFEIAVRDIQPGEQLTDDYGYLNISEPFEAEDEGTERKIVHPDDLLEFHEIWDAQVADAMKNFDYVNQPLLKLFSAETKAEMKKITSGTKAMKSILSCYFDSRKK
ncbi:MAG TPA: SET domain-containing protein [Salinimicrobium sp.]|nr:SET domain-containing protein [Salinimicrobium sp.]